MSTATGIALITRSAQGLGHGIALCLTRDGFDIALNDVSSKHDQFRAVTDKVEKVSRKTHIAPANMMVERK